MRYSEVRTELLQSRQFAVDIWRLGKNGQRGELARSCFVASADAMRFAVMACSGGEWLRLEKVAFTIRDKNIPIGWAISRILGDKPSYGIFAEYPMQLSPFVSVSSAAFISSDKLALNEGMSFVSPDERNALTMHYDAQSALLRGKRIRSELRERLHKDAPIGYSLMSAYPAIFYHQTLSAGLDFSGFAVKAEIERWPFRAATAFTTEGIRLYDTSPNGQETERRSDTEQYSQPESSASRVD